jgi:CheY-like chemotaxis protein
MLGVDALELVKGIRHRAKSQPVAFIAMTGNAKQEADFQRYEIGELDFHLIKPVSPDQLHELLALLEAKFGTQG